MIDNYPQMTNKDMVILFLKLMAIWIAGAIVQAL